jgi:hypothetical protein
MTECEDILEGWKAKRREYYQKNKERLAEKEREYYQKHKAKRYKSMKAYRDKVKEAKKE